MADVKISALPAATTPLAGTEVLPIVQSGVTTKVAVSNLTAGRAVSATAVAITGSTSGTATIVTPAVAGTPTITLPTTTGTLSINGPTFAAYQSSAQAITDGTFTKIQFQTEEWDTASAFDNATNYRFTPLVAGYYQASGGASILQLINNTAMAVAIYKNGVIYKLGSSGTSNAGFYPKTNVSALVYLNGSTDYIELYVAHNLGATYNLSATISATYFQAAMVRSA